MRALSLFTGYGGIDLALKNYISEVLAYVEIEEYAQKIIAYRMADGLIKRAPILADVKNIRGQIGCADIIYGGFPCQDISVAGNGKGLAGERSGLFYEIIRLTKEIRPAFVFLENVPAIRTRGLEQVIKEFTEIGYDCRWTCLSAASVGAPHKRERWFLLAHANGESIRNKSNRQQGGKDKAELRNNGSKESLAYSDSSWELSTKRQHDRTCDRGQEMADSSRKRLQRQWKISVGTESKFNNPSNDSWWSVEPNVGRVVNGTSFRVDRIKAIGNGVVPLQVKTAFEVLVG